MLLREDLNYVDGLSFHVVEHAKLADTQAVFGWRWQAQPLQASLTLQRRVHSEYLFDLVQNRHLLECPKPPQLLHCFF